MKNEFIGIPDELPIGFSPKSPCLAVAIYVHAEKDYFALAYKEAETATLTDAVSFIRGHGMIDGRDVNPLDIEITDQTWLVIGFTYSSKLKFSMNDGGLSLKSSSNKIGHLRYIPDTTEDGSYRWPPEYRILYVAVKPTSHPFRDDFNIHADLHQDKHDARGVIAGTIPLIIDPGIKYPGPGG